MAGNCWNCNFQFIRQHARSTQSFRYARLSIHSKIKRKSYTPFSALQNLGVNLTPQKKKDDRFICDACVRYLSKLMEHKKGMRVAHQSLISRNGGPTYLASKLKLKRVYSPSPMKPRKAANAGTPNFWTKGPSRVASSPAEDYPKRPQKPFFKTYRAANASMRAKIQDAVKRLVRQEVKKFPYSFDLGDLEFDVDNPFCWERFLQHFREACPLFHAALVGSLTTVDSEARGMSKRQHPLGPILGGMASIAIHQIHPKKVYHYQLLNGLHLKMSGVGQRIIKRFHRLGLSQSHGTLQNAVQETLGQLDSEVTEWKEEWGKQVNAPDPQGPEDCTMEVDPAADSATAVESITGSSSAVVIEQMPNIQDPTAVSTETDDSTAEGMEVDDSLVRMDHCYSVPEDGGEGSRTVDSTEGNDPEDSNANRDPDDDDSGWIADEDPCHMYTLCIDRSQHFTFDMDHNKEGCKNNLLAFACLDRIPPKPGVSEIQPSGDDIRSIPLRKFLPSRQDVIDDFEERKHIIARIITKWLDCFQALREETKEPIRHPYMEQSAQKSRVYPMRLHKHNAQISTDGVGGLLVHLQKFAPPPTPSGSATPILVFADTKVSGTALSAQKRSEDHESTSNFLMAYSDYHKNHTLLQDAFDMLQFNEQYKTTNVLGSLANIRKILNRSDAKPLVRKSPNESCALMRIATEAYVVCAAMDYLLLETMDHCFSSDHRRRELRVLLSEASEYVAGLADRSESLESLVHDIVWDQSETTTGYQHCFCKVDTGDTMVRCCNPECPKGTWFHLECLGLKKDDVFEKPNQNYFCSSRCKRSGTPGEKEASSKVDAVLEYSKAFIWHGLNALTREDAIFENDGLRMIRHWKYDMVNLAATEHMRHVSLAQTVVASVVGGCSERVAHQMTWSRTVNPTGKPGQNISMKSQMDHFKAFFIDAMRFAQAPLPESKSYSYGEVLMAIGDSMDALCEVEVPYGRELLLDEKASVPKEHMRTVIESLQKGRVFDEISGRFSIDMGQFRFEPYKVDAADLKESIINNLNDFANRAEMM